MDKELAGQRYRELREMTVDQCAKRGDRFRLVCLDCNRTRVFPARQLAPKHGHKIAAKLTPACTPCVKANRKGVGTAPPGHATYIEIIAPGDPGYDRPAASA